MSCPRPSLGPSPPISVQSKLRGNTINRLARALESRTPASVELCALLHKNIAEDLVLEPRWVGFDAPEEFLVGYGLDHAEDFRHLPFVASI